jgi:hypothetical protein
MNDTTPPPSAAWPAILAGLFLGVVLWHPSPVATGLALWGFVIAVAGVVQFRYALQKWRSKLTGGWAHHPGGLHTCADHPRSARRLTERESARHLRDVHPDTWGMLTSPGAVTELTNRAQRRAARKQYGKVAAGRKRAS